MNTPCNYHTMEVAASPDTVYSDKCIFIGALIETDKTNDVTFTLSDGATEVFTYIVTGTLDSDKIFPPRPIQLNTSMVITLAGTASRVCVLWDNDK